MLSIHYRVVMRAQEDQILRSVQLFLRKSRLCARSCFTDRVNVTDVRCDPIIGLFSSRLD